MTDQKPRAGRNPLNFGVDWLESRPALSNAYQRLALILAVAGIVVGGLAVAGVMLLTWQRTGDEAARGRERDELLGCFDRFASTLAGALPPVREATQKRDQEVTERDITWREQNAALIATITGRNGLGGLLVNAQAGIEEDPQVVLRRLLRTFEALDRAQLKLDAANDELDKATTTLNTARSANPYPPAPSSFCQLKE